MNSQSSKNYTRLSEELAVFLLINEEPLATVAISMAIFESTKNRTKTQLFLVVGSCFSTGGATLEYFPVLDFFLESFNEAMSLATTFDGVFTS